jgi:hypothetical protein
MEIFAALARYLSHNRDLTLAPHPLDNERRFTIFHGGKTLTLEFIDGGYIHYYAEHGTPNEMFRIEQEPGKPAKFSTNHRDHEMHLDQLGDYIVGVLKGLSQESPTA